MTSNWLKVINFDNNYEHCFKELSVVLNDFFDDFKYCNSTNDNIIIKSVVDGEKYNVKKDGNDLKLYYKTKEKGSIKTINKELKLLRYFNNFCTDDGGIYQLLGLQLLYRSVQKEYYDDLVDITKDRTNFFSMLQFNLETGKILQSSSISSNLDILIEYEKDSKYGYPDLCIGTNIYRDDEETIENDIYYLNGISYPTKFIKSDDSLPLALIASDNIYRLLDENRSSVKKRKQYSSKKIGF